ncbi:MAG: DUF5777 family beta-barrel protein [Saprospiraceae bacterium]|nr:DUF5777 family beta-barrel protein [Saprospiraceae bacterium]
MRSMSVISNQVWYLSFCLIFGLAFISNAQDEAPERDKRPVRSTFSSVWLIDNQTVEVPIKGTFEFDIQHRFSTVADGYDNLWGLYSTSNIRLGLTFSPVDRLNIGFGLTKSFHSWDFHAKYALLKQTRSGSTPLSISYLVNMAIDTRNIDLTFYEEGINRFSYFHQIMFARRFSTKFSFQVAPSISHFNVVETYREIDGSTGEVVSVEETKKNNHMGLAFSGRLKITDQTSVLANYDLPLTDHPLDDPKGNFSFGLEFTTSAHAFQIFLGNYDDILPQRNNFFNRNDPSLVSNYLIGFNITRMWNF